jgi:hypothetical protein
MGSIGPTNVRSEVPQCKTFHGFILVKSLLGVVGGLWAMADGGEQGEGWNGIWDGGMGG